MNSPCFYIIVFAIILVLSCVAYETIEKNNYSLKDYTKIIMDKYKLLYGVCTFISTLFISFLDSSDNQTIVIINNNIKFLIMGIFIGGVCYIVLYLLYFYFSLQHNSRIMLTERIYFYILYSFFIILPLVFTLIFYININDTLLFHQQRTIQNEYNLKYEKYCNLYNELENIINNKQDLKEITNREKRIRNQIEAVKKELNELTDFFDKQHIDIKPYPLDEDKTKKI